MTIPKLPAYLVAWKSGWKQIDNINKPSEIVLERFYKNQHFLKSYIETYSNAINRVNRQTTSMGSKINKVSIMKSLLPESTVALLVKFTNQQLTDREFDPTDINKYYQFLATMWLYS